MRSSIAVMACVLSGCFIAPSEHIVGAHDSGTGGGGGGSATGGAGGGSAGGNSQATYSYPGCDNAPEFGCPKEGVLYCALGKLQQQRSACQVAADCTVVRLFNCVAAYGSCPPAAVNATEAPAFTLEANTETGRYCSAPVCVDNGSCAYDYSDGRVDCVSGHCVALRNADPVDAGALDAGTTSSIPADGCLLVSPPVVDFGTAQTGCGKVHRSLTLINRCTDAVTVANQSITLGSFTTTTLPSVTASSVATLDLTFSPLASGSSSGQVTLDTREGPASVARTYRIALQGRADGTGITETTATVVFPPVDLLLVVDNSGSMADKQTNLASNVGGFLNGPLATGADWHVGVIHSEPDATSGELIGTPRVITPVTPSWQAVITQRVRVGLTGGNEQFAAPALRALTEPLVSTTNLGFFRPNARLGILAVTDADDQSPASLALVETSLLALKGGRRDLISFNAFAPLAQAAPSGCSYDDYTGNGATRLRALTHAFGGSIEEICSPDWSAAFAGISTRLFATASVVPLLAPPVGPVTVQVAGQRVSPTNGSDTVWSYDSTLQAVRFEPLYVPLGQPVTVRYAQQCGP